MLDPLDDLKQQRLRDVLLDFGRAPGKYPVRLGEPRELHAGLDTLTMWALGRLPRTFEPQADKLREAAVLFIARACFAPEATHYQLFGLAPGACTPEALRARYRNLIRLTHPDMGIKGLPVNAAGAVNRAYGVLSDPESRRRYDDELADRKASAGAGERERERERERARNQSARRIEHRVTFAERWQSLKARFPHLVRSGAIAGGIVVVAAGLLALALTSQNDDRTLIAARNPDRQAGQEPEGKAADPARSSKADKSDVPPATRTPPRAAEPTIESREAPTSATVASKGSSPPSLPVRQAAEEPNPPIRSGSTSTPSAAGADDRAGALQTGVERPRSDIVIDPSSRLKTEPRATAVVDSGKGSTPEPPQTLRSVAPPAPPAPSLTPTPAVAALAHLPAESRRTPAARSDNLAEPVPTAATPVNRVASAPRPSPTSIASTAPAPEAALSTTAPPPVRVAAVPPAPPPSSTVGNPATRAAQPTPVAGAQVWSVDSARAMHYLSELISMLETPNAAYRTNAYLTEMKVKGSLLRPALKVMRDFSEVDVSQVDWTDSTSPGVLKVRGTLVLQARGPQAPFFRTANFRLTAEFWGTANGTVLAELNLREAE